MAIRTASAPTHRRRAKQSTSLVVFFALVIIAAALIIRSGLSSSTPNQQELVVAAYDTVMLPVPIKQVPAGTKIKDITFKKVSFPRDQVPDQALQDLDGLQESETTALLPANLPIFAENISVNSGSQNQIVQRIPPGMRAMTVHVDETSSVEGWAGSGSLVDILLVEQERTTVVAENVKILSAERSTTPVDGSPTVPRTVTILVTQQQCLAINASIPLGKLAIALRGQGDESRWGDKSFSADNLKQRNSVISPTQEVKGYVAISGKNGKESYALSHGRWVKTEVVPQGFLVARENREEEAAPEAQTPQVAQENQTPPEAPAKEITQEKP